MYYIDFRLGFCSLLKPFKWQYTLIPILPDSWSDFLEAPVPIIIGYPKDYRSNMELAKVNWSRETLVVFLQENRIYRYGIDKGNTKLLIPKLDGLEELIAKRYKAFEDNKGLCYYPTENQLRSVESIFTVIELSIAKTLLSKDNIANYKRNIENSENGINSKMQIDVNIPDSIFCGKFAETQLLLSYIKDIC